MHFSMNFLCTDVIYIENIPCFLPPSSSSPLCSTSSPFHYYLPFPYIFFPFFFSSYTCFFYFFPIFVIFRSFNISSFSIYLLCSSFYLFHIFFYPSFCLSLSWSVWISVPFSQLRRLHPSHIKWRQSKIQHAICTSLLRVSATSK